MATEHALDGWDIAHAEDAAWTPWGGGDDARAKLLANGDGFFVAVVEADAGYRGAPHEHAHTEFLFVLDGRVRTQGRVMGPGDAYVAATGSTHSDFEAEQPSRYLSVFKL